LLNIVVKKLRKSVNICQSYHKNKCVSFFYGSQCMAHRAVIFVTAQLSCLPQHVVEATSVNCFKSRPDRQTLERYGRFKAKDVPFGGFDDEE